MSISYFTIAWKSWCPTDKRVHLFCHHFVYLFFSLSWPSKTPGGLQWWTPLCESAYMMLCDSFCTANFVQEVHLKFHFPWPEVHQHQSLCQVFLEILSSNWTNFFQPPHRSGISFKLCDFIKVLHRLEAKCPGSPPARSWTESHAHLKYSLNKTIQTLASLSMGGQEIMS